MRRSRKVEFKFDERSLVDVKLSEQVAQLETQHASAQRAARHWEHESFRLLAALVNARMEIVRRDNPEMYEMLNREVR